MNEKKIIPQIRFSGYVEEWEKKQFDAAFDMISSNTLSRDNLNYVGGSTQNVHYGDILTAFGEYVDAKSEMLPYVNDEDVALKYQNALLKDGDIIFADTAEDEMVGKCVEIGNVGSKKIISGLHTMPCRPKVQYASKYLGYYLNSFSYHHRLFPLMQGVKVISISKTGIKGSELILSKEYDEQKIIGNFFYHIDKLIKQTEYKIEKIRLLKQTMLIKMFPKEGEKVPEIRFDGFSSDWEQKKLKDYQFYISDGNYGELYPKADEFREYGIPFIRVNNLKNGYLIHEELVFISPELHGVLQSGHLKTGDILITNRGQIGVIAYVDNSFDNSNINAQICLIRTEDKMYSKYLHQYLQTQECQKEIISLQTGTALKQLPRKKLDEVMIKAPLDIEEQEKIGEYFFNIDNLFMYYQQELEKLKNIKEACMKKMFV